MHFQKNCLKLVNILFLILGASCSLEYTTNLSNSVANPDMIFKNCSINRYNNNFVSLKMDVGELELYNKEQVFAGRNVTFEQYKESSKEVAIEGKANLLLVDQKNEAYWFGRGTEIYEKEDDFFIRGDSFFWKKEEQLLYSAVDSEVFIRKSDDSLLSGRGFSANTQTREFAFLHKVEGVITIKEDQKE